jgi:dolichol-phosphate mannosyltransferase
MRGLIIVVNYEQEPEIAAFLSRLAASDLGLDKVIVDDGSADRSAAIAERMGFKVIRHSANRGVGAAIRTGINFARAEGRFDYVVIMSSNGKMNPDELPLFVMPILQNRADYVQGSRFLKGGVSPGISTFRRSAIPIFSTFASVILRRRFTDITCGFRAYRLDLFDNPVLNLEQRWLDRYELELYIHYYASRLGLRMMEVPVTINYAHLAAGRKTKMRPFASWWSMIRPFVLLSTRIRR